MTKFITFHSDEFSEYVHYEGTTLGQNEIYTHIWENRAAKTYFVRNDIVYTNYQLVPAPSELITAFVDYLYIKDFKIELADVPEGVLP